MSNFPEIKNGIIGHRGAPQLAPENTLASFKEAAHWVNWIEFDVQPCASGEWVVMHDPSVDRTTNGHGLIRELPYSALKSLEAGSWFSPDYQNEPIPLLTDVLEWLKKTRLYANIEIKAATQPSLNHLIQLLEQHNLNPLLSSSDYDTLAYLREQSTFPLGYLIEDHAESALETVVQQRFSTLHCHHSLASKTLFQKAAHAHIPLLFYTVNTPSHINELLQAGAYGVFSDCMPKS